MLPDCPGEAEVPGFAEDPRVDTELFVEAGFGVPEPPLDRPTVEPEASVLEPLPVAPLSVELLQPGEKKGRTPRDTELPSQTRSWSQVGQNSGGYPICSYGHRV